MSRQMMAPALELHFIDPKHPLYGQERSLRYEVLRKPLGMEPGSELFAFEHESSHLVAVNAGAVVGCVLFHRDGEGGGRLFQMAIRRSMRRSGLGSRLVRALELCLATEGIIRVLLHARESVAVFYERLGYARVGEPYDELGIPHVIMERTL